MASKNKNKSTSNDVATDAAKLLSNPRTSARTKSVAGSALSQAASAKPKKDASATKRTSSFKAGKDL